MKRFLFLLLFLPSLASAQVTGKNEALEGLGSLSATTIYNYYIVMGMTFDAHSKDVYTSEKAKGILTEQLSMMHSTDTAYINLIKSGFLNDASDLKFVKDARVTLGLLIKEGDALTKYLDTATQADMDTYDDCRSKAWDDLKILLGIKD